MQNSIETIEYLSCGSCQNNLHFLFKGRNWGKRVFPAGVFLIKHRTEGFILYDTGYSEQIKQKKLPYLLYDSLNPITIEKQSRVDQQLIQKGVNPSEIRWIILSHLHPDHIGGLLFFPNARVIVTREVAHFLTESKQQVLLFKKLFPKDLNERLVVVDPNEQNPQFPYVKTMDLFDDGSLLLSSIGGHAKGQACIYLPEAKGFLAADVSWGTDLPRQEKAFRILPRLIQENWQEYLRGLELLSLIERDKIKILVSHDLPTYAKEVVDCLNGELSKHL